MRPRPNLGLSPVDVRPSSNPEFIASGVIVHSDAGSQYTSLAFTRKLLDLGLAGSVGRFGSAYDNAMTYRTIGPYKMELVHRRAAGWDIPEDFGLGTARWVAWFNRHRLHEMLGRFTPIKIKTSYLHEQSLPRRAA